MEIYLIRHTTPDISAGVCYGRSDIPVGKDFEIESKIIIDKLSGQFDAVFSSPLLRCKMLAEKITSYFDKTWEYQVDPRLIEMNFGKWELKKWCEIDSAEFKLWEKDVVMNSPPEGECFMDLNNRANDFLKYLLTTDHHKVVVVTHAGVIRCLLSIINNIPLLDTLKVTVDYGEVFTIQA